MPSSFHTLPPIAGMPRSCLCLALAAIPVMAFSQAADAPSTQLETVQIQAEKQQNNEDNFVARKTTGVLRSDAPLFETAQSISVVTQRQIEEKQVRSVAEALESTQRELWALPLAGDPAELAMREESFGLDAAEAPDTRVHHRTRLQIKVSGRVWVSNGEPAGLSLVTEKLDQFGQREIRAQRLAEEERMLAVGQRDLGLAAHVMSVSVAIAIGVHSHHPALRADFAPAVRRS